jgi:hypothetical protein
VPARWLNTSLANSLGAERRREERCRAKNWRPTKLPVLGFIVKHFCGLSRAGTLDSGA